MSNDRASGSGVGAVTESEGEHSGTLQLLRLAALGDPRGWQALLDRHHARLRRMIALRLDRRLSGRVSPSDVIQEAYLVAATRLPAFLENPEVPFFVWLRSLCRQKLMECHRHHLG